MPEFARDNRPILLTVTVGAFIVGLALAAFGVVLVYKGATGATELTFFGQSLKSTNVGIAAIFVAAAMIVLLIRRTLTTVDRTVSVENQASANQHADPVSAFQDYDIFRAGASSPSENVAILERIVSSKDPRRGEYLQKLSAEPWLAWIEKHAISEGLDGIRTGRKVQNLFETVKAREWAKIDEMFKGIDGVDAVTLVPVFRALKYWRYLNRRNHPMFEEVEHALAFGLVGKLSMDDLKKVISKLAVSA